MSKLVDAEWGWYIGALLALVFCCAECLLEGHDRRVTYRECVRIHKPSECRETP